MSNKLDDELAAEIAEGEHNAPEKRKEANPADPPALVRPVTRDAAPRPNRSIGLLVSLLVMVGAIVSLFMVVFQPAAVYATPVDKFVNEGKAFVGRKVRIDGELVPGSLVKRDSPCEYRFTIYKNDAKLPVSYAKCIVPDGFRDVPSGGTQVTVEGTLAASGEFQASLLMAKCSSKYDPAKHEMTDGPGSNGPLPVN
jgi:cytochrome c-type biogenesis protein CcmE